MVKNNFLKNYFHNLKNAKKNLEIVRSSPVASLKYRYTMQRAMVVLLCLYFVYQFINIIIKYNGGSSAMTLMGRGIILLILVIIIVKSIETLKPLKNIFRTQKPSSFTVKKLAILTLWAAG